MPLPTIETVTAEIVALHRALAAWLSGAEARDDRVFETSIAGRLAPGFYNIQPAGTVLLRDDLLRQLRAGHSKSPGFAIRIRNVALRARLADGWLVATYEEYQRGARNSAARNGRLSTALLRPGEPSGEWLAVHETWLPEEILDPSLFVF